MSLLVVKAYQSGVQGAAGLVTLHYIFAHLVLSLKIDSIILSVIMVKESLEP